MMADDAEMTAILQGVAQSIFQDAERWRRVRRLSYEIKDPDLRGVVCSFLDRFGADVPEDAVKSGASE